MAGRERWTVGKVLAWAKGFLKHKGITAHQHEAEEMLSSLLKMSRVELYTSLNTPISDTELAAYKERLKRRVIGEPLQYITDSSNSGNTVSR